MDHTGEHPYTCLPCDKTFLASWDLKWPQLVHSSEQPFQCGCCRKNFLVSSSLHEHEQMHGEQWGGEGEEAGALWYHQQGSTCR